MNNNPNQTQKTTTAIEVVILILMLLVNTIFILLGIGLYWGLTKFIPNLSYNSLVSWGIVFIIYTITLIRFFVDRSGWDEQISQWVINQQKGTTGVVY